ncbi:MAG: FkbM family methyltransferase [Candidatus Izemoplasmatales bacterium]|jgi:FkbM family methyltransferase
MNIVTTEFNGKPFHYREGNYGDLLTMKENLYGKQYGALELTMQDVVLDIGGHIGTFAIPTSLKVDQVISIEMAKDNYELLELNTKPYKDIQVYNYACVSQKTAGQQVEYYLGAKNSGATSSHIKRGREGPFKAESIGIEEVLEDIQPTIIKCDVEGAEYDIFDSLKLPDCVRQIIIEFHFGHKEWRDNANLIQKNLKKQGFKFDEVDCTQDKLWIRVMYFKR